MTKEKETNEAEPIFKFNQRNLSNKIVASTFEKIIDLAQFFV